MFTISIRACSLKSRSITYGTYKQNKQRHLSLLRGSMNSMAIGQNTFRVTGS